MKESYPNLSATDIQAWVDPVSYRKGESYFRQGAIIEPRRQGMTLKARCLGSSAPSYRVEVTMDDEGITEAECSCPVGAGGHCKHVAALLLTWLDSPEAFEESADLVTSLEQRSKPELIALIRQMLQRYPDLEYLLELPSPAAGTSKTAINPEIIRRQVSHAFENDGEDWGWRDAYETARDLDELLDLAGKYQEQADHTKELLTGWTRSALAGMRDWGQEVLGGLLLDLQSETLDDEAFLEICRQTGRLYDLVERLLQLDRVDEAVSETEKAGDYHLLALADLFVQHGHGSLAERMVRERSETSGDTRLTIWLKDHAIKQGNLAEALELATRLLWLQPSLAEYLEMKKLATQINQWSELRFKTLEKLSKNKQSGLLVEIYLEEGEIDLALEALDQARTAARHRWDYPYSLELQVAEAAEKSRPEQAIRLYLIQVNRLIDQRGRENYAEAADHLKVVRGLYKRLRRQEDWQSLIAGLRQDNRTLRAFQDELNKAGL